MTCKVFEMNQCEESDSQDGPWSPIEGNCSTKRWLRVKREEWDASLEDLGGFGTAVTYDGEHLPLNKVLE